MGSLSRWVRSVWHCVTDSAPAILKLPLFPPKILSGFHLQKRAQKPDLSHMSPYWQHERNNSMHRKECVRVPCGYTLPTQLDWKPLQVCWPPCSFELGMWSHRWGSEERDLFAPPHSNSWPKKFIPPLKHLNCFLHPLNGKRLEITEKSSWFNLILELN